MMFKYLYKSVSVCLVFGETQDCANLPDLILCNR